METQEKQSYLRRLPDSTAAFIKQVIKKMRYRKKVRSEVMTELAAHFEDEFKDCKTDEEKEQKAQQLIADFGDLKLLAILLRRAKKRCRPLWRTIVARTFQAVGVLILCFILYVVWFLTGKPAITTNYVAELNNMVRPVADESLNAAPLYHKATELVEKSIADEVTEVWGKKYKDATLEEKQVIEKQLTDNEEILELVIAGTQKPYYWQKYSNRKEEYGMMGILLPNLSEFRRLAFALRSRAQLRAEQGRYEDAFDDVKSCYRLGQHIRGDKTLIEQLVGIALEALSVHTIRDIVGGYDIDSTVLADFQRNFEQIIADENFAISFKVEKLCMYDEIQRCFTSDRIGKGHLYLPRFRKVSDMSSNYEYEGELEDFIFDALVSAPFLLMHPNKEQTLRTANAFYDYYEKLSLKTALQGHIESEDMDKKVEEFLKGNYFLNILTPAVLRVIQISHRLPVDVKGTLAMIAIFRYKADKGRYPQNFNQLVTTGYLKQLPLDSYSDKPLVYKKTENNFMLYSIGPNFVDDGGEPGRDRKGRVKLWMDKGDVVFWPQSESELKK